MFVCFLIDFNFLVSFPFTAQLSRRHRGFPPPMPMPWQTHSLPHYQCPLGTRENHPKSAADVRIHSLRRTFCGFDKCRMTCTHHDSVPQSGFTALNVLCAPPVGPAPPLPRKDRPCRCVHQFASFRVSSRTWPLHTDFVHFVMCIKFPSCLFVVWQLISF